MLRRCGVDVRRMAGMAYSPLTDSWRETESLDVNYMVLGVKN